MSAGEVCTPMPGGKAGWRGDATVELVDGYSFIDESGSSSSVARRVSIRIEGGFVHVDVAGARETQIMSAPAIRRISYPAD